MGITGGGWLPWKRQPPEHLGLAVRRPGVSSRSACHRLWDLGQLPSPEHILASLPVKWGSGVSTGVSGFKLGMLLSGRLEEAACLKADILVGS